MKYKLIETFYSLKGEGIWTGFPMYFIRFFGCLTKCPFCDTPSEATMEVDDSFLLQEIFKSGARRIVITGGEPILQENLRFLINQLHKHGLFVHLESNGSIETTLYREFDWVAISPKNEDVSIRAMNFADEIKIPWADSGKYKSLYGVDFVNKILRKTTAKYRYLLPLAKSIKEGDRTRNDFIDENVQSAIKFCKDHPETGLGVCHQLHKCYGIK
jgi:7-carboxy-7-deazaguanine synthase